MNGIRRLAPWLALSAATGFAAVLAPLLIEPPPPIYASPIRAAVEEISVWTFHFLFLGGLALGWVAPVRKAFLPLLAIAMVLPFAAVAAWQYWSGSPNVMWPLELVLYALWTVPAMIGMFVARLLLWLRDRARAQD